MVPWALSMWGQTLIDEGRLQDGLDRLEEAMAILLNHALSPRVTPWIYCAAVRGCCLARDFARARAWNQSMARWLDSLNSLGGAYLGNCRIYRSRLMVSTRSGRTPSTRSPRSVPTSTATPAGSAPRAYHSVGPAATGAAGCRRRRLPPRGATGMPDTARTRPPQTRRR